MSLSVLHSPAPIHLEEALVSHDGYTPQGSDLAALRTSFLSWWHCSQECLMATLNLFRRFDDDDITAVYIATWLSALEEIHDGALATGANSIVGMMSELDPARFSGISLARLCDNTGIPRETARRKLDKAADLLLVERVGEARFRLRALSTDIMPLFENCIALADGTLHCLDQPRTRAASDLNAEAWVILMRDFFSVMLTYWLVRRSITRGPSLVSVQIAIELLTTLKIYRRIAATGRSSRISLLDAISIVPECHKTPYYVVQIASISHLPTAHVRRMCRNLAAHDRLEIIGPDIVRVKTPPQVFAGQLPDGVFSIQLRDAGFHFIKAARSLLRTEASPQQ